MKRHGYVRRPCEIHVLENQLQNDFLPPLIKKIKKYIYIIRLSTAQHCSALKLSQKINAKKCKIQIAGCDSALFQHCSALKLSQNNYCYNICYKNTTYKAFLW